MGGGNEPDNIVELTGEEHYVAHQLLVKMHPETKALVHAALLMSRSCTGNKAFGWLRRKKASAMLGNKLSLGVHPSQKTRRKLSLAFVGNKNAVGNKNRLGKTLSEESRAKISVAKVGNQTWLGRAHTVDSRRKIAAARTGTVATVETRAKMSASHTERWQRLRAVLATSGLIMAVK